MLKYLINYIALLAILEPLPVIANMQICDIRRGYNKLEGREFMKILRTKNRKKVVTYKCTQIGQEYDEIELPIKGKLIYSCCRDAVESEKFNLQEEN